MVPLSVFDMRIPDEQLKEFLLVVAHEDRDAEEIEAQLLGRDERTNLAFIKPKADPGSKSESESKSESKSRSWKPIKFEEAPVQVGQPVYSVGILPEMANYKRSEEHT